MISPNKKVYCDASPRGVGACLMQVMNGHERPVAYASRTLTSAETNYAQIVREALAINFCCKEVPPVSLWQAFCFGYRSSTSLQDTGAQSGSSFIGCS